MREAIFWGLVGSCLAALLAAIAQPDSGFDIIRITDNDVDDVGAAVSGSNVVWQSCDGGSPSSVDCSGGDWEIYFWNGAFPIVPIRVTDNSTRDVGPAISGSTVVWVGSDGHDTEIYFWDGSFPIVPVQLSHNDGFDGGAAISGPNVVWSGPDGRPDFGDEIFLWDGSFPVVPTRLTEDSLINTHPAISGSRVVWRGYDGDDYELYLWDGSTQTRLTDDGELKFPRISGLKVVWTTWHMEPSGEEDYKIYFWDGSFPVVPIQITDEWWFQDYGCAISGSNVVWSRKGPGGSWEIYFWDGSFPIVPIRITDNDYSDFGANISGSRVVWSSWEDGNDGEIYMTTLPHPLPVPALPIAGLAAATGLLAVAGWRGLRARSQGEKRSEIS